MSTVAEYFRKVVGVLTSVLGSGEGESAARAVFEDVAGYNRNYIFAYGDREITPFMQGRIDKAVELIKQGEPVQYATGKTLFAGITLKVTPDVLIPRFETEGLVDMIVDQAGGRRDLSVLDIGTGSGCIAIALARALPFAQVTAFDISDPALAVAGENVKATHTHVELRKVDILSAPHPRVPLYDIIVSNPPYVLESEAKDMDVRVCGHEPSLALFVSDDNPLRFYRAITSYASAALKCGGRLYFEINALFPKQICRLLEDEGFADVSATRDYRGNYRFVSGTKKA